MKRTRRWTALGVAVALTPSLAPGALDLGCPHHADLAGHGAHAPPADAHGPHAGTMAEGPASRAPEPSPPAPCTCLGKCSTSSPATSPPEASVLSFGRGAPAAAVPLSSGLAAATRAPYVLPFANGPPGPRFEHATH